jgi:hypothetical protein
MPNAMLPLVVMLLLLPRFTVTVPPFPPEPE